MLRNSHALSVLVVCAFVLAFGASTNGQTRSRSQPKATTPAPRPATQDTQNVQLQKKRPVVVVLKEGGPVNGNFVQANNGVLHVEVAGNMLNINLDDVVSISFSGEVPNGSAKTNLLPPVSRTNEAAAAALRALRKMAGATEVGITYQEYGSRLIDLKAEVDETLSQMPEGELKAEISSAMEAYADASLAWGTSIKHGRDTMFPDIEPATSLVRKYSLPIDRSIGMPLVTRSAALSTIWGVAKSHIERASTLMNGGAPAPASPAPTSTGGSPQTSSGTIDGIWKLEFTGQNNVKQYVTLDIQENGGQFSGTLRFQGNKTPLNGISVQGRKFEFTFSSIEQGQTIYSKVSGEVDGDRMSGTMAVTLPAGASLSLPFTGTRAM